MPLLKIGWHETKGIFRKRTTTHVRITSAWTLAENPVTGETWILFLGGTGNVKITNSGGIINSSCDIPFCNKTIPIKFDTVLQYVERCIAECKTIDLTSWNYHSIETQYSPKTVLPSSFEATLGH